MDDRPTLRIGQLSRRVGVRPELLRVWERRYGVLRPARSEGGFRLYSAADEERIRVMQQKLRCGLSTGEAAREVLTMEREENLDGTAHDPAQLARQLGGALEAFDAEGAHHALDLLLGIHGLESTIREALMPYLRDLGERWAGGEVSVAQEHFASRLIEARLLALARGWNRGPGRCAVLACPPREQHTIPLICFGLVLRSRGWRNIYLGGDSPPDTVRSAADTVQADVVVLSAVSEERFAQVAGDLGGLARGRRLVLAGAGATPDLATGTDADYLSSDPASEAERFSRRWLRREPPRARPPRSSPA